MVSFCCAAPRSRACSPLVTIPEPVLASWSSLRGRPQAPLGGGLINTTWVVEGTLGKVVVQRLHPVFEGHVNRDIDVVTRHLERRGLATPRLLPTDEGALWVLDDEGRPYRAQTFLPGETYHKVLSPEHAASAARLVARFHRAVADLDYSYQHVRASVHDTPRHLAKLDEALKKHGDHRLFADVAGLGKRVLAEAAKLPTWGGLPARHCHGDLKISNLLFRNQEGHALLDLDTLGTMIWPFEMGDALRSWCNPKGEDESRANLDEAIFAAAVTGYFEEGRDLIPDTERVALIPGLLTICLELSARFLADALEERYFGFDSARFATRGEHNLARGAGQLSLYESVVERRGQLEGLLP